MDSDNGRYEFAIGAEDIRLFKIDPNWSFGIARRVEWSDVDAFDHVNHIAYFRWAEEIRNAYLSSLGLPKITKFTPGVVIKDIRFEYSKPIGFYDHVFVTARTLSLRRTSFRMEYAVWKEGLVARGEAICLLIISATGERVEIPEPIRASMIGRDSARPETAG